MDITRINRISVELQAILWSIVNNSGSTIDDLVNDTRLTMEVIEQILAPVLRRGKIKFNEDKYYISQIQDWRFWKDEIEFLDDDHHFVRRSHHISHSPVKDWWPQNDQSKPGLIYYIGPYNNPHLLLYFDLIKPLIEFCGFQCSTSLEEVGSEEFLRQKILPGLKNARFVLCNLSEENSNVHYEFGWLNAFGTPFYAFKLDYNTKRAANIHQLTINNYSFDEKSLLNLSNNIIQALLNNRVIDYQKEDILLFSESIIPKLLRKLKNNRYSKNI